MSTFAQLEMSALGRDHVRSVSGHRGHQLSAAMQLGSSAREYLSQVTGPQSISACWKRIALRIEASQTKQVLGSKVVQQIMACWQLA